MHFVKAKCVVQMTITACDDAVCKIIEPNAAPTSERFAALETLNEAGIPTVVWLTPILPFITDTKENIEAILNRCIEVFLFIVSAFRLILVMSAAGNQYNNLFLYDIHKSSFFINPTAPESC